MVGRAGPCDWRAAAAIDCAVLKLVQSASLNAKAAKFGGGRRLVLLENLYELLRGVQALAGPSFAGTGLIVSADPSMLPITSLRETPGAVGSRSTLETLAEVSDLASEFHDGFHVLSPDLEIVLVSQYFSPPIVPGVFVDPSRRLGGRYMAGLFGSALPAVLATGVVSQSYGALVFERAREVGERR